MGYLFWNPKVCKSLSQIPLNYVGEKKYNYNFGRSQVTTIKLVLVACEIGRQDIRKTWRKITPFYKKPCFTYWALEKCILKQKESLPMFNSVDATKVLDPYRNVDVSLQKDMKVTIFQERTGKAWSDLVPPYHHLLLQFYNSFKSSFHPVFLLLKLVLFWSPLPLDSFSSSTHTLLQKDRK